MLEFIDNGLNLRLEETEQYASIIGSNPSTGARSPSLWNSVFDALNMSAVMHPMDVSETNLETVVDLLRKDARYIGGAVAVPYKSAIVPYLDNLEPEARLIGSINTIYRDRGNLVGANTDGTGAVKSIQKVFGSKCLNGAVILVVGIGGAGRAVATYLAGASGPQGKILLANRTRNRSENLADALRASHHVTVVDLPLTKSTVSSVDFLVNCSTVGSQLSSSVRSKISFYQSYTPLGDFDSNIRVSSGSEAERRYVLSARPEIERNHSQSLQLLGAMKSTVRVIDIIYQPENTMLLTLASCLGLSTQNGLEMNLHQAIDAFRRVNGRTLSESRIRTIMESVR